MQMVVALAPIHRAAGIERLIVATYQAVSGTGRGAVEELAGQAQAYLEAQAAGREPSLAPAVYRQPIAFNVLPEAGRFPAGEDHTDEERKLMNETRKILADQTIRVSATCARVPVFVGHSEAVHLQTRQPLSVEEAREPLPVPHRPSLFDPPAACRYPTVLAAAAKDGVLVGRPRRDPELERLLS